MVFLERRWIWKIMSYSQEKYNLWDCKRDNDNKPSIMHFIQIKKKKEVWHLKAYCKKTKTKITIDLLKTNGIFIKEKYCIFKIEL